MPAFSFRETLLQRVLFAGFFTIMLALITVACFLKVGDNLLWLLAGLLAGTVTGGVLYFIIRSYLSRQTFTVTAQAISSQSRARGLTTIFWQEVVEVTERTGRIDDIRERVPGLEVFISSYVMMPSTGAAGRFGLLFIRARDGKVIVVRQPLVYPSRLEQLLEAIELYSPQLNPAEQILKSNTDN